MLLISTSLVWGAGGVVAVPLAVAGCGGATGPPPPPAKLAFTVQPSNAAAGVAISPAVVVAIQDSIGNTVAGATNTVAVAIVTNPGSGTLAGTTTVTAVRGEATFGGLSIDQRGTGYTLAATSGTLVGATSAPFDIRLSFLAVSAGNLHTCGVITAGVAYCWGDNGSGELGDGTMTSRASPVLVLGGLTFAAVSAAAYHTCSVTTADAAYCWGDNASGQLGDGTTADRTSPVAVLGGRTLSAVSAGFSHTCGVTTAGPAYCRGVNRHRQLSD